MSVWCGVVCIFNQDEWWLFANPGAKFDAAALCVITCAAVVCVIVGIGASSYDGISGGKSALVGAYHVRNECFVFAACYTHSWRPRSKCHQPHTSDGRFRKRRPSIPVSKELSLGTNRTRNSGEIAPCCLYFLTEVGRRLTAATGDAPETAFLFQRISVAIHRINAVFIVLYMNLLTSPTSSRTSSHFQLLL